jgi:3-deoxy-D-manno-octulosonate 8-phosphate phosphatase (KDO 8-P phosphatase)
MDNRTLDARLKAIRLFAMDVDGVLTDGKVIWGVKVPNEPELLVESKQFHVRDGLGLTLALSTGLHVAWITGRNSPLVERRGGELGIRHICQGVGDKRGALLRLQSELGVSRLETLYVGDDLNDLPAWSVTGVKVCVADAAATLIECADWVTERKGGEGAVREVVERVLRAQGVWAEVVARFAAPLGLVGR